MTLAHPYTTVRRLWKAVCKCAATLPLLPRWCYVQASRPLLTEDVPTQNVNRIHAVQVACRVEKSRVYDWTSYLV